MTKPAHRTINYVCYPANYKPGDGYVKAKCLWDALRIIRRMGAGSEAIRQLAKENKRGGLLGRYMGTYTYLGEWNGRTNFY